MDRRKNQKGCEVSRRIEKPEDAIPLILERRVGNLPFETDEVKAFTAAECADIAEIFAASVFKPEEDTTFDQLTELFAQWRNEIDAESNTARIHK